MVVTPRGTQAILALLGTLSSSPYTRKPSVKPAAQPRHVASRSTREASLFLSLSTPFSRPTPPTLSTLVHTSRKALPDRLISSFTAALYSPELEGRAKKPF